MALPLSPIRKAFAKLRTFAALPVFVQLWLVPVWIMLGAGRMVVLCIPFRRLAPHLGVAAGSAAFIPVVSRRHEWRAHLIGRTIRLAASYTPWDSNCFPQAIAARLLLGLYRVPYALFFGLRREANASGLDAHAWVCAGRTFVTGGNCFASYTVVGVFVSRQLRTVDAAIAGAQARD